MANVRKGVFWASFCDSRQMNGQSIHLTHRNELYLNLYKSMSTRKEFIWDSSGTLGHKHSRHTSHTGGIFNVQYSPDGSVLVAATENKNVLIFSSITHTLEQEIKNAHKSCVNLVKFLDSRMFVTSSDDNTIGVWDLRNLSNKIISLKGHKNWVKSLEYDSSKGILISSAYDHSVLKWDINSSTNIPECVLQIKNMLRMVLTPDCSKMIISTAEGYLIIIHDLNLSTLSEDLREFVPELYRLMQSGRNYGIDMGSWVNSLFTAKRNRVELISDFPKGDKNGYITTLDVHPYGWAVLSRNTSGNECTEWTCVHDIQDSDKNLELKPVIRTKISNSSDRNSIRQLSELSSSGSNSWIDATDLTESSGNPIIVVSNQIGSSEPHTTVLRHSPSQQISQSESQFYQNISRLRYYIQELNENHGFIKEQSFSPDGRIICSPYQFGFRLLSFNSNCAEMSDCIENKPKLLYELKRNMSHPDYVVSVKFSPTHCQIASGCLKGRVVFTQPIL